MAAATAAGVDAHLSCSRPDTSEAPVGSALIQTPNILLGLRGLNNLGQTCFMNCILQILIHCPPVARFFLTDGHNRYLCSTQRRARAAAAAKDQSDRHPCLACEMDKLVTQFFSGTNVPYSPHAFLHAMWCHAESFAGYEQQDAHEFFIAMLAEICAALNAAAQMLQAQAAEQQLAPAVLNAGLPRSVLPGHELKSVFSGVLRSEVTCASCGGISTKYEEFNDISLDIARSASASSGSAHPQPPESLLSCLHSFTRKERLGSGERCWCSRCNIPQVSSKQLSVQRLPNVLCFHLKRFKHSAVGKQASKIDTFVKFPLHSLDMYSHTSAAVCASASGAGSTCRVAAVAPEHLYDLFGVAVHHGGMQNGHYTAYVRRGASWFRCDDASVSPVPVDEVRACQAYLLFYIRKALA